jgi:hypothetical protein
LKLQAHTKAYNSAQLFLFDPKSGASANSATLAALPLII